MATPQQGILRNPAAHHLFLEYAFPEGGDTGAAAAAIRQARDAAGMAGEATGMAGEATGMAGEATGMAPGISLVTGFSRALWERLSPAPIPAELRPFATLNGRGGKSVPGTQHDLWFWLSGKGIDVLFAAAMEAHRALGNSAELRLEQQGFHYLDSRDLTGFIDGTANPEGAEAREAALIPEDQPGAGGSHLLAMKWVHDLEAFHALPVPEQERVIGRRKADSEELSPQEKPLTAHISRAELQVDGEELPILRRSVPYGTLTEHGLYFLAFSHDPSRFRMMLERMYGIDKEGIEDRLTDYSRPVSAAYYFAPSEEELAGALG